MYFIRVKFKGLPILLNDREGESSHETIAYHRSHIMHIPAFFRNQARAYGLYNHPGCDNCL